mgnify:CR=1 FL=1
MHRHTVVTGEAYILDIEENEVRFQAYDTDDADYLIVAFGSIARICHKAVEDARAAGIKLGCSAICSGVRRGLCSGSTTFSIIWPTMP